MDRLLDDVLELVPHELHDVSGSVLNSGRAAFSTPSAIYLMGLNPGGDPTVETWTVADSINRVLRSKPANWSAYRDDSWVNATRPPGTWGMQPRVLHLVSKLGLDPGLVPSSNLVFARSRRENDVASAQMQLWAESCWGFHKTMIERLQVRVIVCFGQSVADFVRMKVDAHDERDRFVEANNRGWTSRTFAGRTGIRVVHTTHPSRADGRNPAADVSPLVERALHDAATN